MSKKQPDKTAFRHFIAATFAVLSHPDTPPVFYEALSDAITDAGNKLEAYNEDAAEHSVRVLSRIFGLPEARPSPRVAIQDWVDLAAWCNQTVTTTDKEESNDASPAPSKQFNVPSKFNELAERLAINLGDDELLDDLIRLAFAIAEEPDSLNRGSLALTVASQAFTRTCKFDVCLNSILRDTRLA